MIKKFLRKILTTWRWFCVCYFHGVFGKNQTRILARLPEFSWAFQNHCDFKPFSRILSSNLRKQIKNFSNLSRVLSEKTNRTFDSNSFTNLPGPVFSWSFQDSALWFQLFSSPISRTLKVLNFETLKIRLLQFFKICTLRLLQYQYQPFIKFSKWFEKICH